MEIQWRFGWENGRWSISCNLQYALPLASTAAVDSVSSSVADKPWINAVSCLACVGFEGVDMVLERKLGARNEREI